MKKRSFTSRSKVCFAALLALLTGGCGYQFAASGSGLPAGAQTIYVARFVNHSRITGLSDEFARYLADEIASHRRLTIVDDPAHADLSLNGVIVSDETQPTTFNSVVEPTQYAEQLFVDAALRDNRSHKTIWAARRLGATEFYAAVSQATLVTSPEFLQGNLRSRDVSRLPDMQVATTQRASSRDQIMTQLAHNLYASMSEGF